MALENLWQLTSLLRHLFFISVFFFFFTAQEDYVTHFELSIVRWGENGRSPRKNTRPPASKLSLSHVTELGSNPSGEMMSDLER